MSTINTTKPVININCPLCGKPLVLRTNRLNGSEFLGCSNYPECKHTQGVPESYKLRLQGVRDMFDDVELDT